MREARHHYPLLTSARRGTARWRLFRLVSFPRAAHSRQELQQSLEGLRQAQRAVEVSLGVEFPAQFAQRAVARLQ